MSADDRELTGDEAQRALSEAMRRTRATVPDPTPAELIAFVREQQQYYEDVRACFGSCSEHAVAREYDDKVRIFSALLTVLERPPQEETTRERLPCPLGYNCHASVPLPDAAPSPKVEGCVNCGEVNDGGYMSGGEGMDAGNVGPFCSMCWEFLREHFHKIEPPASLASPPAKEPTR